MRKFKGYNGFKGMEENEDENGDGQPDGPKTN